MSVSDATATPPCFDPSKSLPIEDVKAVIEFCTAWKSDISAEVQLESFSVGADFFYKLVDETEWISSRQFLEPFKPTAKKRGSKKAAASNTVDLPPSKLKNIHHFVRGTWQHGYAQAWTKVRKVYFPYNMKGSHWVAIEIDFVRHTATVYDFYVAFTKRSKLVTLLHPISDTLARVLYDMHFYEDSEVEEVRQKGLTMSMFTPFSVCSIVDVPQQRDGSNFPTYWPHSKSCGILTVKFIEHLSAGISVDKVDPLKIKYYRLKLAIEGTPLYEDADVDALLGGILAPSGVRMGLKFSDLMYVTKRSMNAAVSKLHKLLESVTEAIAVILCTQSHSNCRVVFHFMYFSVVFFPQYSDYGDEVNITVELIACFLYFVAMDLCSC
ncbi:Protein of unknown function D, partial [Prunus dulcis]